MQLDAVIYMLFLSRYVISNRATERRTSSLKQDKPSGPVNISCISHDLEDLRCFWMKSKKDEDGLLITLYRSYFHCSPLYGKFVCPHPDPSSQSSKDEKGCYVASSSDNKMYTFLPLNHCILYVNASNQAGSHITEHYISPMQIVKLSPPKVTSMIGAVVVDLTLSLKPDPVLAVLVEREHVIYEISYRYQDVNKTIIFNTTGSTSTVSIRHLIPYTSYTFFIRNRIQASQGERYWSDTSTKHCFTLPAVPVAVPKIYGYTLDRGIISIYIKPIQEIEKYSENASYNIWIEGRSVLVCNRTANWNTFFIPDITNSSNCNQFVSIKTMNDVGASKNSSQIVIPGYQKARAIPDHVIVEGSINKFHVSWGTVGDNRNLNKTIVIWCVGKDYHCESDLNKIEVSPDITDKTIQTVGEENWIFAVYYVYSDGYITEMVFTQCQFPSVNQAPRGVADFNVIPKATSLLIIPGEFCSQKYLSRPLKYTVLYTEKTGANFTTCEEGFGNISISATSEKIEIMILNLKESTDYIVCLSVTTRGGKSISRPLVSSTLQSYNISSTLFITVLILVASCFTAVLIIPVGYTLHKRWNGIDIQIDLPKIHKIHHEV